MYERFGLSLPSRSSEWDFSTSEVCNFLELITTKHGDLISATAFITFFLSIPLCLLSLNFFPWPSPLILDLLSPPPGCFPLHHYRHLLSFGLTQQFLYLCPAHSSLSHTDLHFSSLQARSQRSRLDHFSLSLIIDNPKSTLDLINDALQSVRTSGQCCKDNTLYLVLMFMIYRKIFFNLM